MSAERPPPPGRQGDNDAQEARAGALARFFVEERAVGWVLIVVILGLGLWAYDTMPKRTSPRFALTNGVAVCQWPGASVDDVERFVTRRIERLIQEAGHLHTIQSPNFFQTDSMTVDGLSVVSVSVDAEAADPSIFLDSLRTRLEGMSDLPSGAGPIHFNTALGSAVPLTIIIASPERTALATSLTARAIRSAIESERKGLSLREGQRQALVAVYGGGLNPQSAAYMRNRLAEALESADVGRQMRSFEGPGFVGIDGNFALEPGELQLKAKELSETELGLDQWVPNTWRPMVIKDLEQIEEVLRRNPADRYDFRELDSYAQRVIDELIRLPEVTRVTQSPDLHEAIYLETTSSKLSLYGVSPQSIAAAIQAHSGFRHSARLQISPTQISVETPGAEADPDTLGEVVIAITDQGTPVYLRDLSVISQTRNLSMANHAYLTLPSSDGAAKGGLGAPRRAITLGVYTHGRADFSAFVKAVEGRLDTIRIYLPDDLIIEPFFNHATQVSERVNLLIIAFAEALVLVLLISYLGFRDWRFSVVLGAGVLLTVALTLLELRLLGVEIQEVSLAALVIALGLLVDDPVVALDATMGRMRAGDDPRTAAWRGPTRLRRAILFATVTNIAAYLPILLLQGTISRFLWSLPIVLTCALISSRFVSFTFVPMLATYVVREIHAPRVARQSGGKASLGGFTRWTFEHRRRVLAVCLVLLLLGLAARQGVKVTFSPGDKHAVAYLDVFLPAYSTTAETDHNIREIHEVIKRVVAESSPQATEPTLTSLLSFVGSSGPRFWWSAVGVPNQPNIGRVILSFREAADLTRLGPEIQRELSANIPGVIADLRELQLTAMRYPIWIWILGNDNREVLLEAAEDIEGLLRSTPYATRVRNNWGKKRWILRLGVSPAVATLSGVTGSGIAQSVTTSIDGTYLGSVPQGRRSVPVILSLRPDERKDASDVESINVMTVDGQPRVPIAGVTSPHYERRHGQIHRRNSADAVSIIAFPEPGHLPSEVLSPVLEQIEALAADLPPSFEIEIAGSLAAQRQSFSQIRVVLAVSVLWIFLTLVFAFRGVLKPLMVFFAIPYGVAGALLGLLITGVPLGIMAYLAIMSLVGIIVSHVIVLFDAIDNQQRAGVPLEDALVEAVRLRTRPVLITVSATALALIPLAIHGGPFWRPFCYAEIGGLTLATLATLILTPALYGILVRDLHWLKWESPPGATE